MWRGIGLALAFALAYVLVLYVHPAARPQPGLGKDEARVIVARSLAVGASSAVSALVTGYVYGGSVSATAEALFLRTCSVSCALWPLGVTAALFCGPIAKGLLLDGGLAWLPHDVYATCTSYAGVRNMLIVRQLTATAADA